MDVCVCVCACVGGVDVDGDEAVEEADAKDGT